MGNDIAVVGLEGELDGIVGVVDVEEEDAFTSGIDTGGLGGGGGRRRLTGLDDNARATMSTLALFPLT